MRRKQSKPREKKPTLSELVAEMYWYFDGFEYGETVVKISKPDYIKYMGAITMRNGQAYIASIPVYIDPGMKPGKVKLESIYAVLKEKAA